MTTTKSDSACGCGPSCGCGSCREQHHKTLFPGDLCRDLCERYCEIDQEVKLLDTLLARGQAIDELQRFVGAVTGAYFETADRDAAVQDARQRLDELVEEQGRIAAEMLSAGCSTPTCSVR